MKAKVIYWQKLKLQNRFILEMTIHDVGKSIQYPDGVKYGLILIDLKTKSRVLMDNHHPKGPHIHINDQELPYAYEDDDKLIEDFKRLALDHMGVKL
jgi:hypothetical protein